MLELTLSPPAQNDLVARIRGGDLSAEESFVHLFNQRVFVMALARTRDREAARELAQDVMMAVLQSLRNGQVREAEKLGAFVYGTTRNLVNNYLRARSQQPQEEPLSLDLAVENPSGKLETAERIRLVRGALERLEAMDRKILLMILVEGYKPVEIAGLLGLTAEAVRQRKSRAVKRVMERLGKLSRK